MESPLASLRKREKGSVVGLSYEGAAGAEVGQVASGMGSLGCYSEQGGVHGLRWKDHCDHKDGKRGAFKGRSRGELTGALAKVTDVENTGCPEGGASRSAECLTEPHQGQQ